MMASLFACPQDGLLKRGPPLCVWALQKHSSQEEEEEEEEEEEMGAQSPPVALLNKSLKTKRFNCLLSHTAHPKAPTLLHKQQRMWQLRKECESVDYALLVHTLGKRRLPHLAEQIFFEMKCKGFVVDVATLSAMMVCYAENGLLRQARVIWDEILGSSSAPPSVEVVLGLIDAYGRVGCFEGVMEVVEELSLRGFGCLFPEVYALAMSCFGKGGRLDLMECLLREMDSKGFAVDSATGSAFIKYYSLYGSLTEMEAAYGRLKRSRHLIEEEGIRAMSFAYIKEKKFYRLGEFLRDVGLGRRNAGNLLWNLLLLSYAANFKMKSLQREFLSMLEAGFVPDITTFNIRMLAFARMSLFWDLHLSLEHMKCEKVIPDLVTYGCIIDAYLDRRLGRNLDFALNRMNVDDSAALQTDPFVFEVLGKGDFHLNVEAFLEYKRPRKWSYRELIAIHLRKQYRSNQIFWNY